VTCLDELISDLKLGEAGGRASLSRSPRLPDDRLGLPDRRAQERGVAADPRGFLAPIHCRGAPLVASAFSVSAKKSQDLIPEGVTDR
jgi:hypothetical protein